MKTKKIKYQEAIERNKRWDHLDTETKRRLLSLRPGNCAKQLKKLNEEAS